MAEKTMTISIIVSLYRAETHLKRFLIDARKLSAELTRANLSHEIILVVNDASGTEKQLLSLLSSPFKVLYVAREPIYASWNRGIRAAQGEYVTFWGVDDTRFAQAIIDGVRQLDAVHADYAYFPFRYHRFIRFGEIAIPLKFKTFTPPVFTRERFTREMHSGPHFMVRRSLFERVGYFDESFTIAGDFEFQVRAVTGGTRCVYVPTISGIFRNDGTTLSGKRAELHETENARAAKQ